MGFVKDTFFGGAEKKAAKAQTKALQEGQDITRQSVQQARSNAIPLFDVAQQNVGLGFQGALDVLGQSLPAQTNVFQQGNLGAQQQLLSGLPLIQNALFGSPIDFSQLQPTQIQTPDLGFFQQQLPQFANPLQQTQQDPNMINQNIGLNVNPPFSGGIFPSAIRRSDR